MKAVVIYSIIFVGIALIFFSFLLVFKEVNSAKDYCTSINETYSFKGIHLCNGEPIYQYNILGNKVWLLQSNIPNLKNITVDWDALN